MTDLLVNTFRVWGTAHLVAEDYVGGRILSSDADFTEGGVRFPWAGANVLIGDNTVVGGSYRCTAFAVMRTTDTGASQYVMGNWVGSGNYQIYFAIRAGLAVGFGTHDGSTANILATDASAIESDKVHSIACCIDNGTIRCSIDGQTVPISNAIWVTGDGVPIAIPSNNRLELGASGVGSSQFAGTIYQFGISRTALTQSQMNDLTANPYQFLEPA